MSAQYGKSAARKHLERGEHEEALDEATRAVAAVPGDPGAHLERAQALDGLGRFAEALVDFERALELDRSEPELDVFELDDAYFASAVAEARRLAEGSGGVPAARACLGRYTALFPEGAHAREANEWDERLRGERPSLLDKTREVPEL